MNRGLEAHGRSRALKAVDLTVATVLLFSAALLAGKAALFGGGRFLGTAARANTAYAVCALAATALAIRRDIRDRWSLLLRAATYPLVVALFFTLVRSRLPSGTKYQWPPKEQDPAHPPFASMAASERAEWGLRVALHAITRMANRDSSLWIPDDWPYPGDVQLAIDRSGTGDARVSSRADGGAVACFASVDAVAASVRPVDGRIHCGASSENSRALSFSKPTRRPWVAPSASADRVSRGEWGQYRRDASRSGAADRETDSTGWTAPLEGPARGSAAVVGDVALIGTHDAGSLEAFSVRDGKNRWRVRLPDWVHQDPVSDGRIAVVGFGDNRLASTGRAPAGVSAYDIQSGHLRWTAFEGNSVMTSPVINGADVAYITSAGVLRVRGLSNGVIRHTIRLPGGAIMSPPAIRNDTMIATLENSGVCAVDIARGRQLWCTVLPGTMLLGHSAPTVLGDTVIVSGRLNLTARAWLGRFGRGHLATYLEWLLAKILNGATDQWDAQAIWAIDVHSGAVLWSKPGLPVTRPLTGHISGTAAADSQVVALILPLAGRVIAFDRRSAGPLWTAASGGTRGPLTFSDGRIYGATGTGYLQVRRAKSGALLCSVRVPRQFDRPGPTRAGGLWLFSSVDGDIVAVPRRFLDACNVQAVQAAFSPRATGYGVAVTEPMFNNPETSNADGDEHDVHRNLSVPALR